MLYNILFLINFLYCNNSVNINRKIFPETTSSIGYDLRKSLPKGYVIDGSIDYTIYIQQVISLYDHIQFPGFPLLVNDKGLKVGSNKTLNFEKGSEIRLKASSKKGYNIFDIRNAKNVQLINPVIKGDRYIHTGTTGEWGMGIGIYSSDNIKILNAKVYDCWGDGIYLGKSGGKTNRDIEIINAYCRNNRRDAISIITVNGLLLKDSYAGYSNGTSPMAGINIEPNGPEDEVQNIKIINPKTEYNKGEGVSIRISKLYGKDNKIVSIDIQNHTDRKSTIGLKSSCYPKRKADKEEVSGLIIVNNPTWIQNQKVPIQTALFQKELRLKIYNPTVLNSTGKSLSEASMRKIFATKGHINPHANYSVIYK